MTQCLDSWAILAWLEGEEPAASYVDAALLERPLMSWINLGEVAYIVERRNDPARAHQVVRELRRILDLELPNEERIQSAASVRARHRMAYGDAFAVATAIAHGADLLTGDPEILRAHGDWRVVDIRR